MNSLAIAFDANGTTSDLTGFFSGFQYCDHGELRADQRKVIEERIDFTLRNPDRWERVKSRRYVFFKRFTDGILKVVASGRQGWLAQIVTVYYLNPTQEQLYLCR
jgi:hypothetical protein